MCNMSRRVLAFWCLCIPALVAGSCTGWSEMEREEAHTQVEIPAMRLSVRLPGDGWTKSIPTDYPESLSERWDNADRTLVFLAFLNHEYVFEGFPAMRSFVEEIVEDFQVSPAAPPNEEQFLGYPALRIEGTGLDQQQAFPSDSRFVQYWFHNERGLHEIAVGAKLAYWNAGGADQVRAIIQSIQVGKTQSLNR